LSVAAVNSYSFIYKLTSPQT